MAKFKIKLIEEVFYEVEIEATSKESARQTVKHLAALNDEDVTLNAVEIDSRPMRVLEEIES